jgi:hypothetical protein
MNAASVRACRRSSSSSSSSSVAVDGATKCSTQKRRETEPQERVSQSERGKAAKTKDFGFIAAETPLQHTITTHHHPTPTTHHPLHLH